MTTGHIIGHTVGHQVGHAAGGANLVHVPTVLGVAAWWSGSHGKAFDVGVSLWKGRSVNRYEATQATDAKQPTYGVDADGKYLRFTKTSSQCLELPAGAYSIPGSGANYTLVFKAKSPTLTGSSSIYNVVYGPGQTGAVEFLSHGIRNDGKLFIVVKTAASGFQIIVSTNVVFVAGTVYTSIIRWNGSAYTMRVNGSAEAKTGARSVNPTFDAGRIGAVVSSGAEADFSNDQIYDIQVYDYVLSDDQCAQVEEYLA